MAIFNRENFENPQASHWPGYFWFINSRLEADEIKKQLRDMFDHGARSVCFHPLPDDFRFDFYSTLQPYLSEEYHNCVNIAVDECHRLGMNYYLYDEGGWPSGNACGQLWKSDPEKYCLMNIVPDGEGSVKLQKMLEAPDDSFAYANTVAPDAGKKFIELTHCSYAGYMKKYFGNTIRFAFTDEAFAPSIRENEIGWCEDFAEEFRKRKGYDITPHLPELLDCEDLSGGRNNPLLQVKVDYCEVMSALFEERYLIPLRQWCRENDLLSGGHFGSEDNWSECRNHCGHILHSLRLLDFPGVDVIWNQLHPDKPWHPFPKLASSAANQNGHTEIMAELFAVYGAGLQPEEMKSILNYMLLCGVNTFIFSNIPYSLKEHRMSMYRPHFGPHHPMWKYFDLIHTYTARMSYLMTCGRPERNTGVFFDMRSFWAGGRQAADAQQRVVDISNKLWQKQCDFDYIDEDILLDGEVKDGKLCYGHACYSYLVIPEASWLSAAAEKRLTELKSCGLNILMPDDIGKVKSPVKITPGGNPVRAAKRNLDNGRCSYYLFNSSADAVDVEIEIAENASVAWADCEAGCFRKVSADNGRWQQHFAPWEACFFISGIEGDEELPMACGEKIAELSGSWKLRPVVQHYVGADDYYEKEIDTDDIPVTLGSWQEFLGEEFSGEVCYSIDFESDGNGDLLDLGKVNYACTVELNGVELGRKMWSPFVFELKNALHKGSNHLEIMVSNTSANLFTDKTREYIRNTFPPESPYDARQSPLEKKSYPSGLFGPIRILQKQSE